MLRLLPSRFRNLLLLAGSLAMLGLACKETLLVKPIEPQLEARVSDAALEQYVFRAFVDLVGNAPTESELSTWRQRLRTNTADTAIRGELVRTLQRDEDYREAYTANLYQAAKVRFLENFPDAEIESRFVNFGTPEDTQRLLDLLAWPQHYLAGEASVIDLHARAVYNLVFDQINMGSFNFVRATFDNLLWRYPTEAEFQAGFGMVDFSRQSSLFASTGASKSDYVRIVTNGEEALEGTVIWQYDQLLARRPSAAETLSHLAAIRASGGVEALQLSVITSAEYAGF